MLFGGYYNDGSDHYYSDTWEWDGAKWTQKATTGPSVRYEHALAYDSARGVSVLFGGSTGPYSENRETWEWDGASWTLRATGGPTARDRHALAYDSARGVTVLFGGFDNETYDSETWEYAESCDGNESFNKAVCKCPEKQKLIAKGWATAGEQIVVTGDNGLGSKTVTANERNKWKAGFKRPTVCGKTYEIMARFECSLEIDRSESCP